MYRQLRRAMSEVDSTLSRLRIDSLAYRFRFDSTMFSRLRLDSTWMRGYGRLGLVDSMRVRFDSLQHAFDTTAFRDFGRAFRRADSAFRIADSAWRRGDR